MTNSSQKTTDKIDNLDLAIHYVGMARADWMLCDVVQARLVTVLQSLRRTREIALKLKVKE